MSDERLHGFTVSLNIKDESRPVRWNVTFDTDNTRESAPSNTLPQIVSLNHSQILEVAKLLDKFIYENHASPYTNTVSFMVNSRDSEIRESISTKLAHLEKVKAEITEQLKLLEQWG